MPLTVFHRFRRFKFKAKGKSATDFGIYCAAKIYYRQDLMSPEDLTWKLSITALNYYDLE